MTLFTGSTGKVTALLLIASLLISGCGGSLPPLPTPTVLIPTLTDVPTVTPTEPPTVTATLAPPLTLPPPDTETPAPTFAATDITPSPAPVSVAANPDGGLTVVITEDQLNTALAAHFTANPFASFKGSPTASLGDGDMTMSMRIVPLDEPSASQPIGVSLTVQLAIINSLLEIRPTLLEPLNVGVTTRQVKLGQLLLLATLSDLLHSATGAGPSQLTYLKVTIQPEGITCVVVKTP